LFPLPVAQLKEIIAKYPNADDYVWAQEDKKTWVHIAHVNELQLTNAEATGCFNQVKKLGQRFPSGLKYEYKINSSCC
jgi:2-oxoglutarate dehydrogenase complex dehydrogenase (E1) component-like enzyme